MVVPELPVKDLTIAIRSLAKVAPGVRNVCDQIIPYTTWWSEQNQRALRSEGKRWVAIGDSLCLGIGATAAENSLVGSTLARLNAEPSSKPWNVINLAMSGAKTIDALERQLPLLESLIEHGPVDVVTVAIGNNDVLWTTAGEKFQSALGSLLARLPPQTIVLEVTGASVRARSTNKLIRKLAAANGLVSISPWHQPGPSMPERQSTDRFHPNDLGYELMSIPLANTISAMVSGRR